MQLDAEKQKTMKFGQTDIKNQIAVDGTHMQM